MIHYELFFFVQAGFTPSEIVKLFGYKRSTVYGFLNNYRKARLLYRKAISRVNSVSPAEEN